MKRASRSEAHHDHAGVLGEYGDGLEHPSHGEVSDGGASAGSEEEDIARWRWPARGEARRSRRSGRARRSCWQTQLASSATASGGADWWRSRAEGENGERQRRLLLFIGGKGMPGVDSARTDSPRYRLRVNTRGSGANRSAVTTTWRRRQAERWRSADFQF